MKGFLKFALQLTGVWVLVMGIVFFTVTAMIYFIKLLDAWGLGL